MCLLSIYFANSCHTVNSRKSRTLFINYDFLWLMVTEIFWKERSKLRHCGRISQLKRKQDGKSIANFVHNFPPQNHYCPPTWLLTICYIYTNKATCLACMLFNCLFLLPYANYALNYTCLQVQLPKWRRPCLRWAYFRFQSRCVLTDVGTLEMLVYNLK